MMRISTLLLISLLAPLAGCRVFQNAAHTLINEPIEFLNEQKLERALKLKADEAWKIVCRENPAQYSEAYEEGFKDGYIDYLTHGGNRQPPAVPPLKYRRTKYLNPQGHALIQDYFMAFKHGTDVGFNSGQRQFLTVPILLPEKAPEQPLNIQIMPKEYCDSDRGMNGMPGCAPDQTTPPSHPTLPIPREMPKSIGLPSPQRVKEPSNKVEPPAEPATVEIPLVLPGNSEVSRSPDDTPGFSATRKPLRPTRGKIIMLSTEIDMGEFIPEPQGVAAPMGRVKLSEIKPLSSPPIIDVTPLANPPR